MTIGLIVCAPMYSLFVQALRNLVNKSGQRALQIFNDLERRLKSADKKDQSGVGGQGSLDRKAEDKEAREKQVS